MATKDSLDIRKRQATVCSVCGMPLEQNNVGRPRVAHKDCRKLDQLLGWAEDLTCAVEMTVEKRRLLRGRLWSLANCLNGKGRA